MSNRRSLFLLTVSVMIGVGLAASVLLVKNGGAAPTGTAANALTFSSPRSASDALPPEAQALAISERPAGVSDELFEGAWLTNQSRRLLSGRGGWNASLYVVPTSKGWLCQVLVVTTAEIASSRAAGGCVTYFSDPTPVGLIVFDPDAVEDGGPDVVAGTVPDRVSSIDVVINDQAHRAPIENNAYLYELADNAAYPQSVVATYRDGRQQRLLLPDPRPVMGNR